jgi:uncharacterized protein DUF6328
MDADAHPNDGRDETSTEEGDRQYAELLQELRVMQTGVQVLFAFLLSVPFAQGFRRLDAGQRGLYFAALLLAGLSIVLLLAPTAWHRLLFHLHDKPHLVAISQRFAIAGLGTIGLTVIAVVALISSVLYPGAVMIVATVAIAGSAVVLWVALPLRRRRHDVEA